MKLLRQDLKKGGVLTMDVKKRAKIITDWINSYCDSASYKPKSLVVGISGGIDSSVVSTLCANTGRKTIVLTMPIKQIKSQHDLRDRKSVV